MVLLDTFSTEYLMYFGYFIFHLPYIITAETIHLLTFLFLSYLVKQSPHCDILRLSLVDFFTSDKTNINQVLIEIILDIEINIAQLLTI